MSTGSLSIRIGLRLSLLLCLLVLIICGKTEAVTPGGYSAQPGGDAAQNKPPPNSIATAIETSHQSANAELPLSFERYTDDLDEMVKRGNIRALVLYIRSGFFYVNGRPEDIYYEALRAFERSSIRSFVPRSTCRSRLFQSGPTTLNQL